MSTKLEKTPLKGPKGQTLSTFSSTFGSVITCLGCAIGTGNVWRFPRILAMNSGKSGALCFLLPWSLFLFIWSVPMLIIEYATGRYTKRGVMASLQNFMGDKAAWCGMWIVVINFVTSAWYFVIMGWCILYSYQVMFHPLPRRVSESNLFFKEYIEDSYWPVLTQAIAVLVTGLLIIKDVKLIERVNILIVPLLLVIVTAIFIWSLTRQGALAGIKFMFTPDWATMTSAKLWVDAASQNAFDSNAAWGMFIAMSAAMKTEEPIVKYSVFIPIGNNIVSLLCGMLTFSTAFSSLPSEGNVTSESYIMDVLQESGPASTGLTFIWLPVLFASAGVAGRVAGSLFFICLVMASVSTVLGIMETVIQTFVNYGLSRIYAVLIVLPTVFVLGLGSSISLDFLTNQDFTWAYALLINGLILQVMIIRYGSSKFREHVIHNNSSSRDWKVPKLWEIIVKFLCPLEVAVLFLFWVVHTISSSVKDKQAWYTFGSQTILPVLLQWATVFVIVITVNTFLVRRKPSWFMLHSNAGCDRLVEDSVSDTSRDKTEANDKGVIHLTEMKTDTK